MMKFLLFPILLVAACLVAGLYGALHNQISYTVSPDYFHAFKFDQFRIPDTLHNRLGASLVGWHASWWMGFLIGVPVLIVGLILPGWRLYASRCLISFAVVAATALLVGLSALAYASFTFEETPPDWFWYPSAAIDRSAFARAGFMHDFSYLGGFLGIFTASLYLIVERIRLALHSKSLLATQSFPAPGKAEGETV
jgi:MFS family permease